MNNRFSSTVSSILRQSKSEAARLDSEVVAPVHLLLAILKQRDCRAAEIISNIQPDALKMMEELQQVATPLHTPLEITDNDVVMNESATRVMRLSMLESRSMRSDDIKSEHLLLAILRSGDTDACRVLNQNAIYYDDVAIVVKEPDGKPKDGFGFADDDEDDEVAMSHSPHKADTSTSNRSGSQKSNTPVLDNFATDLTQAAKEGLLDPCVGRENEIERVAQILSRRKKNNPILIGDPGVGKSAIVEGLASRIVEHRISRCLWDKRVMCLDMGSVVAGTKYRGQFEERINSIINELRRHPEVIIFIDEIHTIIGAGGQAGQMDAANMLKPALARGEIQCIGATTTDEYRKTIEKDGALERRFQKVTVNPTSPEETLQILQNLSGRYAEHHNVSYTQAALEACVRLTDRYVSDRSFPDKAIDALDEAGARKHIMEVPIPQEIKEQELIVEHLLEVKNDAIKNQNFELAADYRDQLVDAENKLTSMRDEWEQTLKDDCQKVDEGDIADVVSMMTGIPVQRIGEEEGIKLRTLYDTLSAAVIGQDEAIKQLSRAIQRSRIGLKDPNKPIGTFMFVGPTGVGKTYLAQKLAEEIFGTRDAMIRIDMSEYGEKHTVSRMVGAPPGYVGYEEGGQLTERVRRKPYSIVLLDEIEKAHTDVFNILLQVMDEGRLTDGNGVTISFKNTIIIMTSNCGTRQLKEFGQGVGFARLDGDVSQNKSLAHSLVKKSLNKQFAPEFLNRLDDIIYFDQLDRDSIRKIVDIELKPLERRVEEMGYTLIVDEAARNLLGEKGYDVQYGARPLKRAIQSMLEDAICECLIDSKLSQKGMQLHATATDEKITIIIDKPLNKSRATKRTTTVRRKARAKQENETR